MLNTKYTGFSIYGRALCLVVDPPSEREEMAVPSAASKRRKASKEKAQGGIEDWYVNTRNEEPGMDDT